MPQTCIRLGLTAARSSIKDRRSEKWKCVKDGIGITFYFIKKRKKGTSVKENCIVKKTIKLIHFLQNDFYFLAFFGDFLWRSPLDSRALLWPLLDEGLLDDLLEDLLGDDLLDDLLGDDLLDEWWWLLKFLKTETKYKN